MAFIVDPVRVIQIDNANVSVGCCCMFDMRCHFDGVHQSVDRL